MQLKDIMNKDVVTVPANESTASAAKKMREANIGSVLVTATGSVVGVLTDRDLAVKCLSENHVGAECKVATHMSVPVTTAESSMDILTAAHVMTENRIKRLPVIEASKLVGLVSFTDIARALDAPMHDMLMGMGSEPVTT